jgi:hypothetical protein
MLLVKLCKTAAFVNLPTAALFGFLRLQCTLLPALRATGCLRCARPVACAARDLLPALRARARRHSVRGACRTLGYTEIST